MWVVVTENEDTAIFKELDLAIEFIKDILEDGYDVNNVKLCMDVPYIVKYNIRVDIPENQKNNKPLFVQAKNPRSKKWALINTLTGKIIGNSMDEFIDIPHAENYTVLS